MKEKSTFLYSFLMFVMISVMLLGGCSEENKENEKKVIRIGQAPYDYEMPHVEILKQIAIEQGYEVKIVKGAVGFMFLSLTQSDVDVWSGVWLPSIHETYHEKYGNQYELGNAIFENAPLGWVVPEYIDINSIADLVGNEDVVNKKLTGIEPGSGMMMVSEKIVKGYDLDMELVAGTMASMMAELDYAVTHQKPIVFLGWRPLAMMLKYDVKVLEDPKGYWQRDGEYWGIRKGLNEDAPDLYNFCKYHKMSLDDVETFLYENQENGKKVEDLAREWIENNRSQIASWLEGKA